MKRLKLPLGITVLYCLFCFAQCKKSNPDNNGLPAATQEGKNTLGFLLNGQPWTPQGNNGTANLSIDFDAGINNGIFSLSAYKIINSLNRQRFGLGIKDSLNFISVPKIYILGNSTLYGAAYSDDSCTFDYFDSTINRSGNLTITRFDKTNRIISGTFSTTFNKTGCPEIKITDGRFDMKF
jgi:hypothetical protein